MNITGVTDIGIKYEVNQDCYRAGRQNDSLYWMVLCDGMGGLAYGERASRIVAETIGGMMRDGLSGVCSLEELDNFVLNAVRTANSELLKAQRKLDSDVMMGTTVVLCVVRNRDAVIAHCGDSRAYHLQKDSLTLVTKDHSVVQELLDSGKITEEQALKHPNRNIITSALGVERGLKVDVDHVQMKKGDMIMMCSDGLSNILSPIEISQTLRESDFFFTAENLVKRALEEGAYDNITAVVLRA